jgi:hypothetical protein
MMVNFKKYFFYMDIHIYKTNIQNGYTPRK